MSGMGNKKALSMHEAARSNKVENLIAACAAAKGEGEGDVSLSNGKKVSKDTVWVDVTKCWKDVEKYGAKRMITGAAQPAGSEELLSKGGRGRVIAVHDVKGKKKKKITLPENPDALVSGATPLMIAALKNNLPMATVMVSKFADPDLEDALGRTALILAIREGNVQFFKHIMTLGADINKVTNIKGIDGRRKTRTPIMYASDLLMGMHHAADLLLHFATRDASVSDLEEILEAFASE